MIIPYSCSSQGVLHLKRWPCTRIFSCFEFQKWNPLQNSKGTLRKDEAADPEEAMIRENKAPPLSLVYSLSGSRLPRPREGKRHGGKTRDERAAPSPAHGLDPKRVERMTKASCNFSPNVSPLCIVTANFCCDFSPIAAVTERFFLNVTWKVERREDLQGSESILYDTIMMNTCHHPILVQTHMECTAPRVNPEANHGLWVMTTCLWRFVDCNVRPALVGC